MVKGISRRVIVVRSPDPRFFEQAIFLLREDALHREGVTDRQVLSEAREVAAGYLRENTPGKKRRYGRLSPAIWTAAGAAAASGLWLAVLL